MQVEGKIRFYLTEKHIIRLFWTCNPSDRQEKHKINVEEPIAEQ